ncbi:hypothetical protein C8J56DRAFT_1030254 [Mycena floridula]|nr:hypothetical protein C8J56DRAFT_1030254 [Mycena floridula]
MSTERRDTESDTRFLDTVLFRPPSSQADRFINRGYPLPYSTLSLFWGNAGCDGYPSTKVVDDSPGKETRQSIRSRIRISSQSSRWVCSGIIETLPKYGESLPKMLAFALRNLRFSKGSIHGKDLNAWTKEKTSSTSLSAKNINSSSSASFAFAFDVAQWFTTFAVRYCEELGCSWNLALHTKLIQRNAWGKINPAGKLSKVVADGLVGFFFTNVAGPSLPSFNLHHRFKASNSAQRDD